MPELADTAIQESMIGVTDMTLGEVVRQARKKAGLSQDRLGELIGVSGVAVGQWESGKTEPSGANALRLIDRLGIDPQELLGDDAHLVRFSPRTSDTKAPLYGRIAAGKPIEMLPVEEELWVRPDVLADHPQGFYLKVIGESMNRVLPDGCFAFVDPAAEVGNGDVAALNVNGDDATVKRYFRGASSVTLAPDSTDAAFADTILDYSKPDTPQVTLIGKVVWLLAPYGVRL